jgi:hypothetical protein
MSVPSTKSSLSILFAAFITVFALDVFSEHYGFWETLFALAIHLIPAGLIVVGLAVSWRWELVGVVLLKTSSCLSPRNHPRIGCEYLPEVEQEAIVVAPGEHHQTDVGQLGTSFDRCNTDSTNTAKGISPLLNRSMPTSLA